MKQKSAIILFVCLLIISSCGTKEDRYMEKEVPPMTMMESDAPPPPPPPSPMASSTGQQSNTKLVKKGEITLATRDQAATKAKLLTYIQQCQGYITNETMSKDEYSSGIEIYLKIKAPYFDRFLQLLDSSGIIITSRTVTVEDVTMQFVDDSTRLLNKKKLEQKYRELLSRAKDMKDVLEIESKLEQVQSDIESREAQLAILKNQIAYSHFTIRIYRDAENVSIDDRSKFTYKLIQGLKTGWGAMQNLVVHLFSIWPVYLIVTIIYLLIKLIIRRRKKKYGAA